jgi:hypothetical protein
MASGMALITGGETIMLRILDHMGQTMPRTPRSLQQVPMKPDHLCRVGKGARAESFRLSCELDRARRAHAVGCQWWARRAKRAFAHPTIQFERDAP